MFLKYDLFEIIDAAIMNNEPTVIVEGKDDYQIYQTIAHAINPKIMVYQSNAFENYEAGCRGVLACMQVLQPKFAERADNIDRILGVIDSDVRPFRDEIPNLIGIFMTKYYSIETYFATKYNLRKLVSKITYQTENDITDDLLGFIQTDFENAIPTLYLFSLEALKNGCVENYDTLIQYDDSTAKIANKTFIRDIMPKIEAKKQDLLVFAQQFNLSITDIKRIAKGKWYLYWFSNQIYPKITILQQKCKENAISRCKSCSKGNFEDCLYKTKTSKNYQTQDLQHDIMAFVDKNECADIVDAFSKLK